MLKWGMPETPTMQQLDTLLLQLDTCARGPAKAVSDAIAATWEQLRHELGTYPPSNTLGASNYGKERQPQHAARL